MADPAMVFHLNLKDANRTSALDDFFAEAERAYRLEDPFEDDVLSVRGEDLEFREALALLLPQGYTAEENESGMYRIRRAA